MNLFERLKELYEDLEDVEDNLKWTPEMTEVHYGCDCGCGGDYLDESEWGQVDRLTGEIKEITTKIKTLLGEI